MAGDLEHRARRINSDNSVAASGEVDREHTCATPDIDDGSGTELIGESEVEVVVGSPNAFGVINRGQPRIFCPQT